MDVYRPLRALLFFYECLRLFLLFAFLLLAPAEASTGGVWFASPAYISANALFLLAALFVWLKPEEYRNYLTLYMSGKIIGVAAFYAWEFFFSRSFLGYQDVIQSLIVIWGSPLLSLTDILSVWGAWTLIKKFRQILAGQPEPDSGTGRGGM